MAVEAGIVYPGALETSSHCISEQSGPRTIVGLKAGSGGTSADGDDAEPVSEIGRRISAPEPQGVLVDVTLRCHARDLGIPPNFIVIYTKNDAVALYRFYDRIMNSESDLQKDK